MTNHKFQKGIKPRVGIGLRLAWTVAVFLSLFVADAQSLSIPSQDTLVTGDAYESLAIFAHAAVKNNASYDIDVMVKRIDKNYTSLTDSNAICWGICYHPDVSLSTMPITIGAGETDSLHFTGHVYPDRDGVPASGSITYVFFDDNNPSDSLSMNVEYQVVLTTAVEEESIASSIQIYPNPVRDFITIKITEEIEQQLEFILYNTAGKLVYQKTLEGSKQSYRLDLSRLPVGTFFYSITTSFKSIKSGKLFLR